jgi:hypothetical protein
MSIFYTGAIPRLTLGLHDIVMEDGIHRNEPISQILVRGSADLALLTGYGVGSVAYTPGFGKIWQLDYNGTWVEV